MCIHTNMLIYRENETQWYIQKSILMPENLHVSRFAHTKRSSSTHVKCFENKQNSPYLHFYLMPECVCVYMCVFLCIKAMCLHVGKKEF